MQPVFAWVDFADADRRKMAQVIDLFREQDTRDEMGIGVVRDALADLLFPGTNTIQTRARYFLFIPWIYRRHERKSTPGADVARKARRDEVALINALVQGGERGGVIGIEKRAELRRPASSIYWSGLGTWNIRRFRCSQEQYYRAWDSLKLRRHDALVDDERESIDTSVVATWDAQLPEAPDDFLVRTSFALEQQEAEYLQHRILELGPTLLGDLVSKPNSAEDVKFVWTHPEVDSFPQPFRDQVQHAQLFSEAMNGAALLYNLMLSEERRTSEWIDSYREQFASWATLLNNRAAVFASWNRADFWTLVASTHARVTFQTRSFVNRWLDLALVEGSLHALADDTDLSSIAEWSAA